MILRSKNFLFVWYLALCQVDSFHEYGWVSRNKTKSSDRVPLIKLMVNVSKYHLLVFSKIGYHSVELEPDISWVFTSFETRPFIDTGSALELWSWPSSTYRLNVLFVFKVNGQAPVRAVQCLPIYRPLSNPWLKVQCLRVGSTINRGPPDTNFVGESNPTSPKLTHTHQKLNTLSHEHRDTKQTHTTNRSPCSTPMKETQHKRAQNKNKTNTMPRLGPCSRNLRAVHQSRRPSTGGHRTKQTKCPD